MTDTAVLDLRAAFYEQLHCRYQRHAFDNWLVWGGSETIEIDGTTYGPTLARAYIEPGKTSARAYGALSALHRRHRRHLRKRRPCGGRQRAIVD